MSFPRATSEGEGKFVDFFHWFGVMSNLGHLGSILEGHLGSSVAAKCNGKAIEFDRKSIECNGKTIEINRKSINLIANP